jgi:hypothetical protein
MNSTRINRFRFLLMVLVLILVSCGQDSVFYDISNEPEPRDPLIDGSPTNIVVLKNRIFTGTRMSNKIYYYASSEGVLSWKTITLPAGYLGQLATDGEDLYVLIFHNRDPLKSSMVRRYNINTNIWDMSYTVTGYSIQTIFGAGNKIFAGGQSQGNRQNYTILFLEQELGSFTAIKFETSLLMGAAQNASGIIYLATAGSGMFIFNESTLDTSPVRSIDQANLSGIISVGSYIVAVSADGNIYSDTSNSGRFRNAKVDGVNFTGAMCVWLDRKNQWRPSLLLLGIRGGGTSLTHGYREMVLDNGKPTFNIKSPGDNSPTSVVNKAKYAASIGTHPVEFIMQIPDANSGGPLSYHNYTGDPDWEPPILASTAKSGLWSYRKGEWNAED